MSELKAISGHEIREDIDYNTRGIDPENKEWRNYGKELCDTLYYRKSEADKVIAELKDKCQMHNFFWDGCGFEKRGFKNAIAVSEAYDFLEEENAQLKESIAIYQRNEKLDIREIRRHKYKRCLAMAKWCESEAYIHEYGSEYDENLVAWFGKWYERWLRLAEKFKDKEAK